MKKNIEISFDKGSHSYDEHSIIQKSISNHLISMFKDLTKKRKLKKKNFGLELGCGTGDFSRKVIKIVNFEKIHLIDISRNMIEIAKRKIKCKNISFQYLDFDKYKDFRKHNFIFSNMSIHWSEDFDKLFKFILDEMPKNSFFLCSFLNSSSFKYFKKLDKNKGESYFNNFPDVKKIKEIINYDKFLVSQKEISMEKKFNHPIDFFCYLKKIGANAKLIKKKNNLFFLRKIKKKILVNFNVNCVVIEKL